MGPRLTASPDGAGRAAAGTTFYALAMGFDIAAQLVLFLYLSRAFSVDTFGRYALLTVAGTTLVAVTDLGCGTALVRALADEVTPARRASLIATAWWARAAIALGVAAIIVGLGVRAPDWLSAEVSDALPAAAVALAMACLFAIAQDALRGQENHLRPALAQVVRAVVRTGCAAWWVGVADRGLAGLIWAVGAGSAAAVVVCVLPLARAIATAPSLQRLRELLRFGVPVGAYITLRHLSALDRYVIAYLLGVGATGAYHVASMPCLGIELLELAGVLALEPYIYRVAQDRPDVVALLFRRAALALIGLSLILGIGAPEVLAILAPSGYAAALGAMPLLVFAAAARASARVLAMAAGQLRQTRIFAITGALDLVASAALLPLGTSRFGLTGAAAARIVAALLSFAVCAVLVRKLWPVPVTVARVGVYLGVAAAAALWLATYAATPFAAIALRAGVAAALLVAGWLVLGRAPTGPASSAPAR